MSTELDSKLVLPLAGSAATLEQVGRCAMSQSVRA